MARSISCRIASNCRHFVSTSPWGLEPGNTNASLCLATSTQSVAWQHHAGICTDDTPPCHGATLYPEPGTAVHAQAHALAATVHLATWQRQGACVTQLVATVHNSLSGYTNWSPSRNAPSHAALHAAKCIAILLGATWCNAL